MARKLYELCGQDPDLLFSPYVWRTRMALAHKGLDFETVPWRFIEKGAIAFSGQERVPVLVDGQTTVFDSWKIAEYLEETYPDRPSLFGGPAGLALTRFVANWSATVFPRVAPLAILAVHEVLDEENQTYFRTSREKMIGRPLEEVMGDKQTRLDALHTTLDPLRSVLSDQPFFGGSTPLYADYLPFGILQWVRVVTGELPVSEGDPVEAWFERLLDAHGGAARAAKTV